MAREGKAPAFQLYARDLLATMYGCELEEWGAVLLLKCLQWEHGPRRVEGLAKDLGVTRAKLAKLAPALGRVFEKIPTEFGEFFVEKGLEIQREGQRAYREENRRKGLLSAAAKSLKGAEIGSTAVEPRLPPGSPPDATDGQPDVDPAICVLRSAPCEVEAPEAPDGAPVIAAAAKRVKRPQRPKVEGPTLPFRADAAAAAVAAGAGPEHFVLPPGPMAGGHAIAIEKHIRTWGEVAHWRDLGEYLASGRLEWMKEAPGVPFLASAQLPDAMQRACLWAGAGKPAKGPGSYRPQPGGVAASSGQAYQESPIVRARREGRPVAEAAPAPTRSVPGRRS